MTDRHARLRQVMPRVTQVVHELAGELDLTNDELFAALSFLTEVGQANEFILLSDVLGLSRLVDDRTHAGWDGTSSNVTGPFYVPGAPWIDNPGSIVRTPGTGTPVTATGVVRDASSGASIANASVDIWQADGRGVYSTQDPARPPWHLRGRQRTDAAGRYAVQTVVPLHYTVKDDGPVGHLLVALGRHPFRPAHIHFLVEAEGHRSLMTQAYVAGGPYLENDAIDGVKDDLIVAVVDGTITFDINLSPASS